MLSLIMTNDVAEKLQPQADYFVRKRKKVDYAIADMSTEVSNMYEHVLVGN